MAFAVLAAFHQATASAEQLADPDYWKQTPERRATVHRFVYSQSPQTIPASYDAVREAEEILRQQSRTLPPSSPQARSLWRQSRTVPIKAGLSPAVRSLGTIGLVVGTFELGWKIGSGINAKFLRIGIPEPAPNPWSYRQEMVVTERDTNLFIPSFGGSVVMPETGWAWRYWTDGGPFWTVAGTDSPEPRCRNTSGFRAPTEFREIVGSSSYCYGLARTDYGYYTPLNQLDAAGPIADYNGQPYDRATSTPQPPTQSAVEQTIDTELDTAENEVLRDWLNYRLGSPGQTDPTGVGAPNPDVEFPRFVEHWEDHGDEFATPYEDPVEYWRDAAEIVERGRNGDPTIRPCHRDEDDADLFWDDDSGAIVVVKDGKITTYFVPDDGFAYFARECRK